MREPIATPQAGYSDFGLGSGADNAFLLSLHLEVCVPLRIAELRSAGRPLDSDFARVRGYVVPMDTAEGEPDRESLLCAGAEAIMFRMAEKGRSAQWVSALVDALAVLSFCVGGVRFAGMRWQSGDNTSLATVPPRYTTL